MKNWNSKDVAEMFGIVAVVSSLVFVGLQLQQDRNIADSDRLDSQIVLEIEFAQMVQESTVAWRKGLAGEQLEAKEEVEFDLIAYALFRMRANSYRRTLVFDDSEIDGSENGMRSYAFFIYENPGMRAWFNRLSQSRILVDRAFGLPDELRFYPRLISVRIRQLEESNPELPEKRFFPY